MWTKKVKNDILSLNKTKEKEKLFFVLKKRRASLVREMW